MPAPITPPEGHLCIGGPYAGRIVATQNGHPRFVASEPDRLKELDGAGRLLFDVTLTGRFKPVIYTLRDWRTSEGHLVQVWAPAGQDAHTTMRLLLAAYQATPIKEPMP